MTGRPCLHGPTWPWIIILIFLKRWTHRNSLNSWKLLIFIKFLKKVDDSVVKFPKFIKIGKRHHGTVVTTGRPCLDHRRSRASQFPFHNYFHHSMMFPLSTVETLILHIFSNGCSVARQKILKFSGLRHGRSRDVSTLSWPTKIGSLPRRGRFHQFSWFWPNLHNRSY